MSNRNLSPHEMFCRMANEHIHECAFDDNTVFSEWKRSTLPKVLATLGDWPERVPLNAEMITEWEQDGVIKQRWLIDVSKHSSAAFIIARPKDLPEGEKRPAILCWHGHGSFGKDSVMGIATTNERRAEIDYFNYAYGVKMAQAGYITYAIDWIGMGERNDSNKPHYKAISFGRDWCNIYYLQATMLGMTPLSINLTHGMAATDFACTLPFVDQNRLGVMGLSGGGTMTLWTALCDERFKAAEIICYSDLWRVFGIRDTNYCGMQITPGIFKLLDLPDLQGLLAPKPLLIDIGVHDTCFHIDSAMQCYHKVEHIYAAAGASERLELDKFPGEHGWGGNKSVEFFGRYI